MDSSHIKALFDQIRQTSVTDPHHGSESGPRISANTITSKAGSLYEKLRYLVDYRDDHTIRRAAIERILKRKILFENGKSLGASLLQELVRAGYIANNSLPETVSEQQAEYRNVPLVGSTASREHSIFPGEESVRTAYAQAIPH